MRQKPKRSAKVVIYTTQHCPHCQHAKHWLKKNNVPFLDFNVAKPGRIQKQFFKMGGRNVPLIVVGEQKFSGFNPQQLKVVLSKQGLMPLG